MKNVTQWVFLTLFIVFSIALFFKQSFTFCIPLVASAYFYFQCNKQFHYSVLEEELKDLKLKFSTFQDNTRRIDDLSDKMNQIHLANGIRKLR